MPSDITEAITQDQIAESLLGTPAPTEETQPAGAEAQEEVAEETQTVDETAEVETQETADDWLPNEQEKVFPAEVLAKYAPRYGFTAEELEGDPRIARIVQDKLNSDIFINQLQQQQELQETDQPAEQQKPEPTQQNVPTAQWLEHVNNVAKAYVNPEVAQWFAEGFLNKTFGMKESPSPEVANNLAQVFTAAVINVMTSVIPDYLNSPTNSGRTVFQEQQERNYEGFHDSYETQSLDRAWQKAVSSDSAYAKLPSFNTVGSSEQRLAAVERLGFTPEEFENLQLRGKDGKPLSAYQNNVKKFTVLAKQMVGQKISPSEAKTFVEAGKKAARQQQIRRETGNLGSGKSNGQISGKTASGPFQTNSDLFDAEAMDLYRQQHGSL